MTQDAASGLRAFLVKKLAHFTLRAELHCAPGELVALVGPSGAGKTTVLRCLAGLEAMDGGEISFNGAVWNSGRRKPCKIQARRVGLLSQECLLFPHMSVRSNVAFALNRGEDPMPLLQGLGVAHLRDRKPHEISGGERQRVALCQVLARRPQLLLLDEPFSALDVENRLALRERLAALREAEHLPVIHVTHDLGEAIVMADRVVSLRQGQEDPAWYIRQLAFMQQDAASPWRAASGEADPNRAIRAS